MTRYDELKTLVGQILNEDLKKSILAQITDLEEADFQSWCDAEEADR